MEGGYREPDPVTYDVLALPTGFRSVGNSGTPSVTHRVPPGSLPTMTRTYTTFITKDLLLLLIVESTLNVVSVSFTNVVSSIVAAQA